MEQPFALWLASSSTHRRELLTRLQLPFQWRSPDIDESEIPNEAPATRAARLSLAKAQAIAAVFPEAIVIGSDQVGSIANDWQPPAHPNLLHKPGHVEAAVEQLLRMSGRTLHFHTGVAVMTPGGLFTHVDQTVVSMRSLNRRQIEDYVRREPALDCAGGFKCEGLGASLFDAIETRDPTALIGLPMLWITGVLLDLKVLP